METGHQNTEQNKGDESLDTSMQGVAQISTPKHQFKVSVEKHASFAGTKIALALEAAVNSNFKHNHVVPIDFGKQDLFAVRAGKLYNELEVEEQNDIVSHFAFIELVSDDADKKKVRFAIWKRIKASQILR